MSRSRMMNDDDPQQQPSSPRTTIVGGRPPESDAQLPPVPTGIQRLLRLASLDSRFRRELIERRGAIAPAAGVPLTDSERAILAAIPASLLTDMAAKMPPPPEPRRDFLRKTAATAVVLLGGAALGEAAAGCDKSGSHPDEPDRPVHNETPSGGGAAPDMPEPDRPVHNEMQGEGGAAPDEPPELEPEPDAGADAHPRPDHREMELDGGANPEMPPERPDGHHPITRGATRDMPPPQGDKK